MNKVLFKKGTVLIQTYCVLQCCPFVGIVNESILTESKHQIFCNCYGSVTFKAKEEFLVVVVGVLLLLCVFFCFPHFLHCYQSFYRRRFVSLLQIMKSSGARQHVYVDLRALRVVVSFISR